MIVFIADGSFAWCCSHSPVWHIDAVRGRPPHHPGQAKRDPGPMPSLRVTERPHGSRVTPLRGLPGMTVKYAARELTPAGFVCEHPPMNALRFTTATTTATAFGGPAPGRMR